MTKVKVVAYMSLPEVLGWREKVIELRGDPTFADLLNELPELKDVIEREGREGVKPIVLIHGKHVEFLGGLKAKLKDGDEVSVFPPAAGG